MKERGSGILLHITSLPSPYGIGDLGPGAYTFADFLAQSKQRFWQILPINPIDPVYGNSPYHSISAFASNLYLISPELMVQEGLLFKEDLEPMPALSPDTVHYQEAITYKVQLFHKAYEHFKTSVTSGYEEFVTRNAHWLDDFSLFQSLKEHVPSESIWKGYSVWVAKVREYLACLRTLKEEIEAEIGNWQYIQEHRRRWA